MLGKSSSSSRGFTTLTKECDENNSKSTVRRDNRISDNMISAPIGLRIIIQRTRGESNVVVKSSLRFARPSATRTCCRQHGPMSYQESSFLKACHLCRKQLSLIKDIYMYRGDQGFCSVECRNRQIYIDEVRELDASTKLILSSYRSNCRAGAGAGTGAARDNSHHRSRRRFWAAAA